MEAISCRYEWRTLWLPLVVREAELVGAIFRLQYGEGISNVDALWNLTSIVGNIDIGTEGSLLNLDGLGNVVEVTGYIFLVAAVFARCARTFLNVPL